MSVGIMKHFPVLRCGGVNARPTFGMCGIAAAPNRFKLEKWQECTPGMQQVNISLHLSYLTLLFSSGTVGRPSYKASSLSRPSPLRPPSSDSSILL